MCPLSVAVVFGTRPDAVKMAPVVHALSADARFRCHTIATAQHRQMLDEVLSLFGINAEYDLAVMTEGQTLTDITTRVLERVGTVLADIRPDVVLVHGDTTTSTAAALAAYYQKVPVGHVEAGLRTSTIYEPFPEEMNRRLTGALATYHFAPTLLAKQHLLAEGKDPAHVIVTGNTVIDAFLWVHQRVSASDAVAIETPRMLFVEAHRRENLGAPFEGFCRAFAAALDAHPDVSLVWPVHPNPPIVEAVQRILGGRPRVHLMPPLSYKSLVATVARCTLLATDSGGLQEEAPCLGKPVLVLRRVTERPEGLSAGTLRLIGTDEAAVLANINELLDDRVTYVKMAQATNPYGDGEASRRITDALWAYQRNGGVPDEFTQSVEPTLPQAAR
ncbi:MAG: UDP-N-acetylglucosamine 2-epimerase (non-hydrolyzing) [Candidatus Eremiobacter antarcticus]|nr:UDP-N-acetylglucosamine 2-epimerase (non-hydrolyzing) [Candidatus Eremiobacteraeota bacterium]MBC5808245.1 UDP-N-acetylglucosamine 2-epimerase (non-hydrolyzing) [Candidatus Eremiobacteraeota bacterium]PZR63629.1 MAG: UDP-N-acetylglucosamine 2-epimerase (non-hydrolyzing) [Candidatus Eremiobacter sp. RRmetagenome_bin22]